MFRCQPVLWNDRYYAGLACHMAHQLPVRPTAAENISATVQIQKNLVLTSAFRPQPIDVDTGQLRCFDADTDRPNKQGPRDCFEVSPRGLDRHVLHVEFLHVTAG